MKNVYVLGRKQPDQIAFDESAGFWRNPGRAGRVIAFIENLTVPSGIGEGTPLVLIEEHIRYIRDVYEPCDETGKRIVRDAILSKGRKNAKSTLIAALVLVHLVGPESIRNGEIYSAANDKEQAAVIYKICTQFIEAEPELQALCRPIASKKRIVCYGNGTIYQALSRESRTKHGQNTSFAIYDELGQTTDRELYDTLNTSFGARTEPLFAVISTQSRDPQHILSELIDAGLSDLDPSVVCHLYAVPDEIYDDVYCFLCDDRYTPERDDADRVCRQCGSKLVSGIYDERVWRLANPALGKFLTLASVRKLATQARNSPSFEPSFRNLTLNQRVDTHAGLINASDWKECRNPACDWVKGERVYLGLDLSATTDLSALVGVSEKGDRLKGWYWKPAALIAEHEKNDRVPYGRWVTEGKLIAAPGRDIDYEVIAYKILEISLIYEIVGIAFDPWRMKQLMKCFDKLGIAVYYDDGEEDHEGIRFVQWGQGFKSMGPAVDALDKAIARRTLQHNGDPVLTWCASNAVATPDPAGNRKLDKTKARFRIDGIVAAVQALGLKAIDADEQDDDIGEFLKSVVST